MNILHQHFYFLFFKSKGTLLSWEVSSRSILIINLTTSSSLECPRELEAVVRGRFMYSSLELLPEGLSLDSRSLVDDGGGAVVVSC
jgi:hypothetical protein